MSVPSILGYLKSAVTQITAIVTKLTSINTSAATLATKLTAIDTSAATMATNLGLIADALETEITSALFGQVSFTGHNGAGSCAVTLTTTADLTGVTTTLPILFMVAYDAAGAKSAAGLVGLPAVITITNGTATLEQTSASNFSAITYDGIVLINL